MAERANHTIVVGNGEDAKTILAGEALPAGMSAGEIHRLREIGAIGTLGVLIAIEDRAEAERVAAEDRLAAEKAAEDQAAADRRLVAERAAAIAAAAAIAKPAKPA